MNQNERIAIIETRVNRLVSDAESEKHNHADTHRDMWKSIRFLENAHWKQVGIMLVVQIVVSVVVAIILKQI